MILNTQLDPCVAYGFAGGPEFQTRITMLRNGHERRNASWSQARHRWSAPFMDITPEAYAEIKRVFMACRGQAYGFLFSDPLDNEATLEALGDAPIAGTDPVQLFKSYTADGQTSERTITRPESAGFTLYEGGVAKAGTLDTETGEFTPAAAWAGGALTWTGTFLVPVRFASDWLPMSYDDLRTINGDVEIVEVFGE